MIENRVQIESLAATLYLDEYLATQPEAFAERVAWHELPKRTRIKYRVIAIKMLEEPCQ